MKTFNLIIKGDTNDADYISQSIPFDENDEIPLLPTLKDSEDNHYDAQPWKYKNFAKAFGLVLEKVKQKYPCGYNWMRECDDEDEYMIETVKSFIKVFYGIDVVHDLDEISFSGINNQASNAAIEKIVYYLESNFLPFENYGDTVHSIVKVSVVPTSAEEVYYEN